MDLQNTYQCVQCGYCCTKAVCTYGYYDPDINKCGHLTDDNKCGIYDQIIKDPNSKMSPAFGAGCSSTLFNTTRDAKIRRKYGNN